MTTFAWRQVLLTDSNYAKLAQELNESIGGALDALDTAAGALETAAEAAEIVDALLAQNPVSAALQAIEAGLDAVLSDLVETDVYMFPLLPTGWRAVLKPYTTEMMLSDLNRSIADIRDPYRPVFTETAGAFVTFTIVAGANNWHDFERTIRIFGRLFSGAEFNEWSRFADLRLQYQDMRDRPIPRTERYAHGTPWDWHRTNWQEVAPAVGDLLQRLLDALDSLRGHERGFAAMMREAITLLRKRVQYLRDLSNEVAELLALLADLTELLPRCSVLVAYAPAGGTPEYLNILNNSANRPQHQLVGGVTLVAGTANPVAAARTVSKLLGIQLDLVQVNVDRIGNL